MGYGDTKHLTECTCQYSSMPCPVHNNPLIGQLQKENERLKRDFEARTLELVGERIKHGTEIMRLTTLADQLAEALESVWEEDEMGWITDGATAECVKCGASTAVGSNVPIAHTAECFQGKLSKALTAYTQFKQANQPTEDCPDCPNQGWYTRTVIDSTTGEPEQDQEQCEWCHTNPNSKFNRQNQPTTGATDTQRLDWLEKNAVVIGLSLSTYHEINPTRQAIDAAMKREENKQ